MLKRYQKGKSMHDQWPDKDELKNRQFQVRLYEAPSSAFPGKLSTDTVKYVCMILNDYKKPNDGLKNYKSTTTITSLGSPIQFLQCDDMKECKTKTAGMELQEIHNGVVTHSDGWCAGPIDNETGVSIKVTNIERMEGVNFLGADGTTNEFAFQDNDIGLTGKTDGDGLMTGGGLPEILIKPGGILKAY